MLATIGNVKRKEIIESNNVCTVLLYLFKIDEKRIITKVTKVMQYFSKK